MLRRWFHARLRTAAQALADGRLDDALRHFEQIEDQKSGRSRKLKEEAGRQLLARARVRAEAGAYRMALDDLDQLTKLRPDDREADQLRQRVRAALGRRENRDRAADAAALAAEQGLRGGRVDSARAALDRVRDTGRREALRAEVDEKAGRINDALQQVLVAREQGDLAGACRAWADARRHGWNAQVDEVGARLAEALADHLLAIFRQGALVEFQVMLQQAGQLTTLTPRLAAVVRLGKLCERAGQELERMDAVALRESLVAMQSTVADCAWLAQLQAALDDYQMARDRVRSSPLRQLAGASSLVEARRHSGPLSDVVSSGSQPDAVYVQSRPLLALVDTADAALLIGRDVIRIGRMGAAVEVPLAADVLSHHAEISRSGEDYFLSARGAVRVNGRSVQRTLLRDGDEVRLGERGKLTFRKPSRKSGTAVLQISNRCRPPQDVAQVVLFADVCLVGPRSSAHIRTREGGEQVVLFEQGGRLHARLVDGQGLRGRTTVRLALQKPAEFGELRITFTRYDEASPKDRAEAQREAN